MVTIAETVEAHRASRPARGENEPPTPFEVEQAALGRAGLPKDLIAVGERLPDIELVDPFGATTTLTKASGGRRSVVVFYRGAWCPYCNIALRHYQSELLPELERRNISLIAVSPQKPDGSLSMTEKNELSFVVLSDPANELARAVGIVMSPSEDALAHQRDRGLDLTDRNADGTPELPMPTTLVVSADGDVEWLDVHPDYTTRSEASDILSAVDRTASTTAR